MARCNRCGAIYQDGAPYCPNCGAQEPIYEQQAYQPPQQTGYSQPPVYNPPPVQPPYTPVQPTNPYYVAPQPPQPPYNGMSIAGFVLSCVSMVLCCFPITAIIGLILSIVSLPQMTKTGDRGKGLAIAGLILNGLVILFWIVMLILSLCGVYADSLLY